MAALGEAEAARPLAEGRTRLSAEGLGRLLSESALQSPV